MRFLTKEESRAWCGGNPPFLDDRGHPVQWPASFRVARFVFTHEPAGRLFWLSRQIVASLDYWEEALLWVVLTGVWASSDNTHLYYRLRQSYGDLRHLDQAPGHLMLRHESEDLITILQLCMMFGWDAFVFPNCDYDRAFVSHDEYGEVAVPEGRSVKQFDATLNSAGLKSEILGDVPLSV